MKQCDFKTSYDGEMFEDPFDVFLTKIGCAKGSIFYLEGLSKIKQRTFTTRWRTVKKFHVTVILMLCGDISTNPGP